MSSLEFNGCNLMFLDCKNKKESSLFLTRQKMWNTVKAGYNDIRYNNTLWRHSRLVLLFWASESLNLWHFYETWQSCHMRFLLYSRSLPFADEIEHADVQKIVAKEIPITDGNTMRSDKIRFTESQVEFRPTFDATITF